MEAVQTQSDGFMNIPDDILIDNPHILIYNIFIENAR